MSETVYMTISTQNRERERERERGGEVNKGENWDGWGWGGRVEEAAAIFMEAWRGKCFCCNCCCVLRGAKADDALHEILALPQAPHMAARLVPREVANLGGEGCCSTHGGPTLLPVTALVTSGALASRP